MANPSHMALATPNSIRGIFAYLTLLRKISSRKFNEYCESRSLQIYTYQQFIADLVNIIPNMKCVDEAKYLLERLTLQEYEDLIIAWLSKPANQPLGRESHAFLKAYKTVLNISENLIHRTLSAFYTDSHPFHLEYIYLYTYFLPILVKLSEQAYPIPNTIEEQTRLFIDYAWQPQTFLAYLNTDHMCLILNKNTVEFVKNSQQSMELIEKVYEQRNEKIFQKGLEIWQTHFPTLQETSSLVRWFSQLIFVYREVINEDYYTLIPNCPLTSLFVGLLSNSQVDSGVLVSIILKVLKKESEIDKQLLLNCFFNRPEIASVFFEHAFRLDSVFIGKYGWSRSTYSNIVGCLLPKDSFSIQQSKETNKSKISKEQKEKLVNDLLETFFLPFRKAKQKSYGLFSDKVRKVNSGLSSLISVFERKKFRVNLLNENELEHLLTPKILGEKALVKIFKNDYELMITADRNAFTDDYMKPSALLTVSIRDYFKLNILAKELLFDMIAAIKSYKQQNRIDWQNDLLIIEFAQHLQHTHAVMLKDHLQKEYTECFNFLERLVDWKMAARQILFWTQTDERGYIRYVMEGRAPEELYTKESTVNMTWAKYASNFSEEHGFHQKGQQDIGPKKGACALTEFEKGLYLTTLFALGYPRTI